jgi:4-alpha-glucanotransferase
MALDSTALRDLARDLGVGTDFWGWDGTLRSVADDTLQAVLAGFGAEVRSDEDIARIRREREQEPWRRTLPPVTVLRQGQAAEVPVHVDHGTMVQLHLELEEGGHRVLPQVEDFTPPFDLDGTLRGRARFALPGDLPLGWHRLVAQLESGQRVEADVVITPSRLTTADAFGSRRAFGVQAQLYSVRSQRSWGIGDLADMRDLAAITAARHGADFLLVNPLHASYPTPPMEPSPYLPVTRRFTSHLYLSVEDVPEFSRLPEHARQRLRLLGQEFADANRRTDHLERDRVLAAKLEALDELYSVPRTPGRQALLDAYRAREGEGLEDFALWCAIAEQVHGTRDDLLRDLDATTIEQARTELADRIDFHAWVQWLLDQQMASAQAAAVEAGMRIGIMHDLAVGVEQIGADSWRLRDVLADGVAVGAPADQYNQQGQNWDQPPWHPERLRDASYRPWRDMLRTLMRHAGALRIDHVLGLFRLWWIPRGHSAADGAYVSYDHEAMIGILALEAERSGTVVIGEDLGTFEPWVREHLSDRGILGTSILWFEFNSEGRPLPPENYRRLCMASVNTHDLPPTAGYLAGDHVELRHRLGLLERSLEEEHAADAAGREEVLESLREEGLLTVGAGVEDTVIALHRHLARTPSLLLGVSLVDCVGERRIQNQPGTDEEYANWRIPLADAAGHVVGIDDIATDERTARLLDAVREGISSR